MMTRVTVTFDEQTLASIRRVAGRLGMSRFLNEAVRERLGRMELLGLLDELDEKFGPAPDAVLTDVARTARRVFRPT